MLNLNIDYELNFLFSLIITLVIEIPVLLIIFRKYQKKKNVGVLKLVLVGAVASCLTLPYLWFILPVIVPSGFYTFTSEVLAILVEMVIYRYFLEVGWKFALGVSITCNILSFSAGLLL
ncbi:hypothetical protein JW868_01435 [Candidatus Woesearchaeota archaeon]|nr:hypothetical protein [Candidatus Woesearchaeota archaeon]